jgi:hypothetical protein
MVTLQSFTVVLCVIPNQSSHPISTYMPYVPGKRHYLDVLLHILGIFFFGSFDILRGSSNEMKRKEKVCEGQRDPTCRTVHYRTSSHAENTETTSKRMVRALRAMGLRLPCGDVGQSTWVPKVRNAVSRQWITGCSVFKNQP